MNKVKQNHNDEAERGQNIFSACERPSSIPAAHGHQSTKMGVAAKQRWVWPQNWKEKIIRYESIGFSQDWKLPCMWASKTIRTRNQKPLGLIPLSYSQNTNYSHKDS